MEYVPHEINVATESEGTSVFQHFEASHGRVFSFVDYMLVEGLDFNDGFQDAEAFINSLPKDWVGEGTYVPKDIALLALPPQQVAKLINGNNLKFDVGTSPRFKDLKSPYKERPTRDDNADIESLYSNAYDRVNDSLQCLHLGGMLYMYSTEVKTCILTGAEFKKPKEAFKFTNESSNAHPIPFKLNVNDLKEILKAAKRIYDTFKSFNTKAILKPLIKAAAGGHHARTYQELGESFIDTLNIEYYTVAYLKSLDAIGNGLVRSISYLKRHNVGLESMDMQVLAEPVGSIDYDAINAERDDNETLHEIESVGEQVNEMAEKAQVLTQVRDTIKLHVDARVPLTLQNAEVTNNLVNSIRDRYALPSRTVGMENFLYDESNLVATEELFNKVVDTLTSLIKSIGPAAREMSSLLDEVIMRAQGRGKAIMREVDLLKRQLDNLSATHGKEVPVSGKLNKLRINGETDIEGCLKFAESPFNIEQVATRWDALWTRSGKVGSIWSGDFQTQSGEYLAPLATVSSKAVTKVLPKSLKNATPLKVIALPGNVFVINMKSPTGIISTTWGDSEDSSDRVMLPAISDKEETARVLNAAYTLASLLDARLDTFIKASDSVLAAADDLANHKNDDSTTDEQIAQCRENVKAAYAYEHAMLRSLWNTAEGLLAYARRSSFI